VVWAAATWNLCKVARIHAAQQAKGEAAQNKMRSIYFDRICGWSTFYWSHPKIQAI